MTPRYFAARLRYLVCCAAIGGTAHQKNLFAGELAISTQDGLKKEVILRSDETTHYFDLHISPLYHCNGHLTIAGRLIVLNEITAHKQAERAVQESKFKRDAHASS